MNLHLLKIAAITPCGTSVGGGDLKLFRFVKIQYERLRKELSSGRLNYYKIKKIPKFKPSKWQN